MLQLFQFHRKAIRINRMERVPESVAGNRNLLGNDTLSDSDSRYSFPFPVTCLYSQSRWCGPPRRLPEIILICCRFCFHWQEYTLRVGNQHFSCFHFVVCPEAFGGSRRPALSTHILPRLLFHRQAVRIERMDRVPEYSVAGNRN